MTGRGFGPIGLILARILLVDDEEAFAYSAAKALRGAGYEVVVVPDHRRALPILEDKLPLDLMISDVVMPERVNGFALARMGRMRRPELKVLFISGYDLPKEEAIGKVLRKPISLEELVTQTHRTLAGEDEEPA
jgi:two-component system cell cycle response regulator CpdR